MADNFDRFQPDWVVGTLTITSGSRNFTATNAQLSLAAVREGDTIITPGGLTLPIESINANGNGGVLAQNAPAGAAGTYATRIRYQSDNSRFTGMLAALVSQLAGGNLQSLAKIVGLQDNLVVFTAPGTLALLPTTSFAGVYSGDAPANVTFPVGHPIACFCAVVPGRNQVLSPRLHATNANEYTTAGTGALLTGTWRSIGGLGGGATNAYVMATRTA